MFFTQCLNVSLLLTNAECKITLLQRCAMNDVNKSCQNISIESARGPRVEGALLPVHSHTWVSGAAVDLPVPPGL